MKYFLDTEFLEGTQKKSFLGIPVGNTKPTIDLISIGIVAEDGREYYAISKDFNLREAWNRYDVSEQTQFEKSHGFSGRKIYWIRENVLRPIFDDLLARFNIESRLSLHKDRYSPGSYIGCIVDQNFRYSLMKFLIKRYGKSNKQIASEIINFINPDLGFPISAYNNSDLRDGKPLAKHFDDHNVSDFDGYFYARPEFYTYYGAYDHVAFCWLFGKMIDLPKGFPMYTIDLKQILDEKAGSKEWYYGRDIWSNSKNRSTNLQEKDQPASLEEKIGKLKRHDDYPKQTNEHNALADARWNKKLYDFLKKI